MLKPVEPCAFLMNLCTPDGPVSVQVEQRLCSRAGAKVNDMATTPGGKMAAAVGPEIQRIEVLVLGEIVGIGQSSERLVVDLGLDIGAVDLRMSEVGPGVGARVKGNSPRRS